MESDFNQLYKELAFFLFKYVIYICIYIYIYIFFCIGCAF